MKLNNILISIFIFFLTALNAQAVTLAWDHDDHATVNGYHLYYQPADQSAGPYQVTIDGGNTLTATIPDENFKPGQVNDFWIDAFNATGQSAPTSKIQWTRPEYTPGQDTGPDTVYIMPGMPKQLIIINQ